MARRSARDWILLGLLVFMWGTAFGFTRVAVASVPATTLVAGRVAIAALVLRAALVLTRRRLPARGRIWLHFFAMASLGTALPFFLISWGQERIDSGLAGILMAVMPLTTLVLAHFFVAGERITGRRLSGFALGFLGIAVLLGPEALLELGGGASDLVRQGAVLGGAVC